MGRWFIWETHFEDEYPSCLVELDNLAPLIKNKTESQMPSVEMC